MHIVHTNETAYDDDDDDDGAQTETTKCEGKRKKTKVCLKQRRPPVLRLPLADEVLVRLLPPLTPPPCQNKC